MTTSRRSTQFWKVFAKKHAKFSQSYVFPSEAFWIRKNALMFLLYPDWHTFGPWEHVATTRRTDKLFDETKVKWLGRFLFFITGFYKGSRVRGWGYARSLTPLHHLIIIPPNVSKHTTEPYKENRSTLH